MCRVGTVLDKRCTFEQWEMCSIVLLATLSIADGRVAASVLPTAVGCRQVQEVWEFGKRLTPYRVG